MAVFVLGLTLGFVSARSDPTESKEYRALAAELSTANARNKTLTGQYSDYQERLNAEAEAAQAKVQNRADQLTEREAAVESAEAELDGREADVAAREKAVTTVEDRIAETSIGEGVWTVGVDVEPGTYRTKEALTGYCYWGIYRSGTNGDDIIENDGPEGGYPTVTLREGQDFENSGCGTFVKQS